MKARRVSAIFLSLFAAICISFASACVKNKTELVGFNDETVQGSLYSDFVLSEYIVAFDTEGNVYRGEATVEDEDGNDVVVLFNRFEPTKVGVYKATIAVTVGKERKTRTITVEVEDRSVPAIALKEDVYVGTVGAEYILPAYEAKKVSGEAVTTSFKVLINAEDGNKDVTETVKEGRFTPQLAGDYLFEITASDSKGISATKIYPFIVRPQMEENALEDFSHETSRFNATAYGCDGAKSGVYYTEFNGANGVVLVSSPGSQNVSAVRFNKTYEQMMQLGNFEIMVFRIYLDVDGKTGQNTTHPFQIGAKVITDVPVREWYDFKIQKDDLLKMSRLEGETADERWNSFCLSFCITGNGCYLFTHHESVKTTNVYIDNIYVYSRPAMAENMLEDFNDASTAANVQYNQYGTCDGSGNGSWWSGTYHEEYAGAKGVVEIVGHTEGASGYVPIRFSRTEAELLKILNEMKSITIRVYVTTNQWVVPVGQSGKVLKPGEWQDITITKEQLLTGTTAEEFAKAHCNTGSGKGNTFKRANTKAGEDGTIYIDYISFER